MQSHPDPLVSPHGMHDDPAPADPVIERLLRERAGRFGAPAGMVDRIVARSTPIVPQSFPMPVAAGRARLQRFALAAGLAIAAGVSVVAILSSGTGRVAVDIADAQPDPSAGLTPSEPVLVSLLAGSETDPAGADEHPAEAILRVRDASFADMQGEVLMVVSAGAGSH